MPKYKWRSVHELPVIKNMPDPLLDPEGDKITKDNQWPAQREYIKAMLAHYLYGHMPDHTDPVLAELKAQGPLYNGKAIEKFIRLKCGPDGKIAFPLRMVYPAHATNSNGKTKYPAIIKNEFTEQRFVKYGDIEYDNCPIEEELVTKRKYVLVTFNRSFLAPDKKDEKGPVHGLYPQYDWGTIAVWAWGHMRVTDYLYTLPIIDINKLCYTGHSRGGKTALCAGIYDERAAIVVPNGSGCGGAGSFRFLGGHEGLQQNPEKCETVGRICAAFPHWWHPNFKTFGSATHPHPIGNEVHLPFDANTIRAAIAPRAVLSTEGLSDDWSNPVGTQIAWQAAQEVFDFLGVSENNAIHLRQGTHDHNKEDWTALADFCDKHFT